MPKISIISASSNVSNQMAYVNEAEQVLVKPRTTTSTFFIDQQRGVHFSNNMVDR